LELVFQGNLKDQFFHSGKRRNFAKIKKPAFTNPTFFVFKIRDPQEAICCENFGRFHRRKFKKIASQVIKKIKKHICLGISNSRLKPIILTEMIVKHYLIIAYYM